MSVKHLERLQLDADRVIAAFSFLSSYAQSCLKERGNTEVGDEPSSASPSTDARYQRQWNLTVEAASTLFEAGQWAMLIDPERALDL